MGQYIECTACHTKEGKIKSYKYMHLAGGASTFHLHKAIVFPIEYLLLNSNNKIISTRQPKVVIPNSLIKDGEMSQYYHK